MADYKISDLTAYPNDYLQTTDLIEVSYDDSGTFKSRKLTADKLKGYTVYAANLSQTSTSAPTADVFENTLSGTPTFGYTSTGVYTMTLSSEWVDNKTFVSINTWHKNGFIQAYRVDADTISIRTYNTSLAATDAILEDTSIEIRVYP